MSEAQERAPVWEPAEAGKVRHDGVMPMVSDKGDGRIRADLGNCSVILHKGDRVADDMIFDGETFTKHPGFILAGTDVPIAAKRFQRLNPDLETHPALLRGGAARCFLTPEKSGGAD